MMLWVGRRGIGGWVDIEVLVQIGIENGKLWKLILTWEMGIFTLFIFLVDEACENHEIFE